MKYLFIVLGSLCVGLGILGIFLPLLPTTPFLLLAAALYVRSSSRLYHWLLYQPYLGPYIRNFRQYRAIPLRVKVISVTLVWVTILYSVCRVVESNSIRLLLLLLAIAITWHILSYKTLRKEDLQDDEAPKVG
ncbi:MAG: YbaN family protein [Bacteroidaceae bacterium]|nr:YbaN family protein [Bacteroidaceae bacterium]